MRTLYFDCFAGASGDMILGALVAAGAEPALLKEQLSRLGIDGFSVEFASTSRAGIGSTFARVITRPEHSHRGLRDIQKIIASSELSNTTKELSSRVFQRLGEAEARVHNQPLEQVHFHEVGALDAIVDVVGAAICFELLDIERFVCSPIHVGSGTVEMEHGTFPVPPPAVVELLKGVPIYATGIKGELITPTGAAIITSVCNEFGPIPRLRLEQIGYGAGSREYDNFPNTLRVLIGDDQTQSPAAELLWMIETNVDDMSPQIFSHVMEKALELGALDCYLTPVQMKKNRPGVLLSILCRSSQRESLGRMLFAETTTLGIRFYEIWREALERRIERVETDYGAIDVKVASLNGNVINVMPEFEQCRAAAQKAGVPLRQVQEAVRAALAKES